MKYNQRIFVESEQEGSDLFKNVEGAADIEPNSTQKYPTQPVLHTLLGQFPPANSTHTHTHSSVSNFQI